MSKTKGVIFAALLFGTSGFNNAKALTADELLNDIIVPVYTAVVQFLVDLDTRVNNNDTRIAALESEPRATIAPAAPTRLDDINAGYTEGSVWVDTTDKAAFILIDSTPGRAIWKVVTATYRIGDVGPAGGIIFHVTDGGLHGLETPLTDQGQALWGCEGTAISGADGTAVGTGAQNTADILAGCATPGIAARVADEFILNGFSDWFLPSKDELSLLKAQKDIVGGFTSSGFYWSSSEHSDNFAWIQEIAGSTPLPTFKNNPPGVPGVRVIRAF